MPKISIICPSFNHEDYVHFFLQSILDQTFQDFELIVVDDYSSDGNIQRIKKFQDARIKLIEHDYNKGINEALNTAFTHSRGEILVFCSSDDMLEPNALEIIYNIHTTSDIVALYCDSTIIDENNKIRQDLMSKTTYYDDKKNYTRYDFLAEIFLHCNPLKSPGMSIKRKFYKQITPLPPSLCILQDVHMHARLLLLGEVKLIKEKLVRYRFPYNKKNISAHTLITEIREEMETQMLLDTFIQELKDIELIKKIFAKEIDTTKIKPHTEALQYFFGRMALLSECTARRQWGFRQIMQAYNDNILHDEYLYRIYNFTFKDYLGLSQYCFNSEVQKYKKKHKTYKKLFNITLATASFFLIFLVVIIMQCNINLH